MCIVIDGSTAGVLPEKMLEKIKAIQAKMNLKSNNISLQCNYYSRARLNLHFSQAITKLRDMQTFICAC